MLMSFLMIIFLVSYFLLFNLKNKKSISGFVIGNKFFKTNTLKKIKKFKIKHQVMNPNEEPIADIVWMKKAARVAKASGLPYFNILTRTIVKKFEKKSSQNLSVIEGTIQVSDNQMSSDFDSFEILSLILEEN